MRCTVHNVPYDTEHNGWVKCSMCDYDQRIGAAPPEAPTGPARPAGLIIESETPDKPTTLGPPPWRAL
mgnify:CR=1 FL=1